MTALNKQALREAAEKALPAMKRLLMMPNDELFDEALLNVDGDVDAANAFNLLAGPETVLALLDELEAEDVACIDRANLDYLESGADADVWPASGAGSDDVLLYAAPQLPQPAVGELTAETLPDEIKQMPAATAFVWMDGWNKACRAAMLQGAEPATDNTNQQFESLSRGGK